jgi:hypothetical protein
VPRLQRRVQDQREGVVEKARDELSEEGTRTFEAGVFVDFDEPDLEFLVDDVVKSEYLEAVGALVGVDFPLHRVEGHESYLFDPAPDGFHLSLLQFSFQIPEGQLVPLLKLTVA